MTRGALRSGPRDVGMSPPAAELLFALQGTHAVADPDTRACLVRAVTREHARRIERLRAPMVAATAGSARVRDWVHCLVRPVTEHLEVLGNPTWYARFCAQLLKDPALHDATVDVSLAQSPSLRALLHGLECCLPGLPAHTHFERATMARYLIVQACAERETALCEDTSTLWSSWDGLAAGLVDGITGLWEAPVTHAASRASGPPPHFH
ncbi:hypothetical protein CJD44_14990 [Streptomyces sp. alain-838]|nr:TetR family transcriptional regulator [Streptomyces sp. alain-838]PAK25695.1 hypothetical protein CJD44_14990 [Streptomyces sp. alain-838]